MLLQRLCKPDNPPPSPPFVDARRGEGKPDLKTRGKNCKTGDARRSGKENAKYTLFQEECFFVFYAEHDNKIGRGLLGT